MSPCFSLRGKSTLKYGSMYYSNALGLFSSLPFLQTRSSVLSGDRRAVCFPNGLFILYLYKQQDSWKILFLWASRVNRTCDQVCKCHSILYTGGVRKSKHELKKTQTKAKRYLSTQSRMVVTEHQWGSRFCAHQSAWASVCDGDKTAADGLKV